MSADYRLFALHELLSRFRVRRAKRSTRLGLGLDIALYLLDADIIDFYREKSRRVNGTECQRAEGFWRREDPILIPGYSTKMGPGLSPGILKMVHAI